MRKALSLISILVFFTACSHQPPRECTHTDWYEQGRQDGAQGLPHNFSNKEVCSAEDADAKDQYQIGHNAGLVEFCQPHNAFEMGLRNSVLKVLCPLPIRKSFDEAYKKGRATNDLSENENKSL